MMYAVDFDNGNESSRRLVESVASGAVKATAVARAVRSKIVSWCWKQGAHRDQYDIDDVLLRSGMLRIIGKGILLEVLVLEGKRFTPYKKTCHKRK